MDDVLTLAAGPTALKHIREHGLSPNDVSTIFGASGAAKWLAIAGLDKAIFGDWMTGRTNATPVNLYGTSVGAFKLAAAARRNPTQALATLAQAYIAQSYSDAQTPNILASETRKTLIKFLGNGADDISQGVSEILTSPHYHLHIGAVRAHGYLTAIGVAGNYGSDARFSALGGERNALHDMAERVFFRLASNLRFEARDGFQFTIADDEQNFYDALRASGTIPFTCSRFISLKTRIAIWMADCWTTTRAGQFLANISRHCFVPAFLAISKFAGLTNLPRGARRGPICLKMSL